MKKTIIIIATASSIISVASSLLWQRSISNGEPGFPLDDAWIHATFAKNLIDGHFWEFNLFEKSTACTAPLWVYAIALPMFFGLGPIGSSLVVNFILLISISTLLASISARLGASKSEIFAISAIIPFVTPITHFAISGMETLLSILLVWLGIYLSIAKKPRWNWSAFIFGISVWARPDNMLVMLLWWMIFVPKDKKIFTAFYVSLPVIGFFVFNFAISGKILPMTFYAKVSDEGLLWAIRSWNLAEMVRSIFFYPIRGIVSAIGAFLPYLPIALVEMIYGFSHKSRGIKAFFMEMNGKIFLLVGSYVIARAVFISPSAIHYGRYIGWVFPAMAMWLVRGVHRHRGSFAELALIIISMGAAAISVIWAQWLANAIHDGRIMLFGKHIFYCWAYHPSLFVLVPFACAGFGIIKLLKTKEFRLISATAIIIILCILGTGFCIGIETNAINQLQVASAKWCARNLPDGSTILTHDIGAAGYFCKKQRIRDLWGLLTPQAHIAYGGADPIHAIKNVPHDYFLTFTSFDPSAIGIQENYVPVMSWRIAQEAFGWEGFMRVWRKKR